MIISEEHIALAKVEVLQAAFGICSLSQEELLAHLEKFYWEAFRAGVDVMSNATTASLMQGFDRTS